jgi:shikimate kinase
VLPLTGFLILKVRKVLEEEKAIFLMKWLRKNSIVLSTGGGIILSDDQ